MRRCLVSRPLSSSPVSSGQSGFKQGWQKGRGCKEAKFIDDFWKPEMRQKQKLLLPCELVCSVYCRDLCKDGPASWTSQLSNWSDVWHLYFLLLSICGCLATRCGRMSWRCCEYWPEQKSVGGGSGRIGECSHSWEVWGYHGGDVIQQENPNQKETKPHWCCYLWDDLLNS